MRSFKKSEYISIDDNNTNFIRRSKWKKLLKIFAILTPVVLTLIFLISIILPLITNDPVTNVLMKADESDQSLIVKTPKGTLRGKNLISRNGRDFQAFLNIPFGKPPIGELRFKELEESDGWEGERDATNFPDVCPQRNKSSPLLEPTGSEDCMYLDIYRPKGFESTNLPVIFYIFGGGFLTGTGRFDVRYFMDEDVIFVIPNYRLGVLGFISTGDKICPGNLGFKDQVVALKWVQSNVEFFGGNPNAVTLFGNSAGAMSVHNHVISPLSKNLFHRAISSSGVSICPETLVVNPKEKALNFSNNLGCKNENSSVLIECLRKVPAYDFIKFHDTSYDFGLVVEPPGTKNPFLLRKPMDLMLNGDFNKVPYIIGIVNAEGLQYSLGYVRDEGMDAPLDETWNSKAPRLLRYDKTSSNSTAMTLKIREFYFGNKRIANETLDVLTDMFSDFLGNHCSYLAASILSKYIDVYTYMTHKVPPKRHLEVPPSLNHLLAHADDLQYFLQYRDFPLIPKESKWYNYSAKLVRIFSSFAKEGKPLANGLNESEWLPVDPNQSVMKWYKLDDTSSYMDEPFTERMKFMDSFPQKELYYL